MLASFVLLDTSKKERPRFMGGRGGQLGSPFCLLTAQKEVQQRCAGHTVGSDPHVQNTLPIDLPVDQDVICRAYDQPILRTKQDAIASATVRVQVVDGVHDGDASLLQPAYKKGVP